MRLPGALRRSAPAGSKIGLLQSREPGSLSVWGSGNPLLLLHGLVGSGRNWRQNIEFLSGHVSVYAIDLFNMGELERVPGLDVSLETTVDRLVTMMDALGIRAADIAAHSHGGAIAMILAARHPVRVRKLILFAPANPLCDAERQLIGFYSTRAGIWFARLIPLLPRLVHATALRRMYGDPARVAEGTLETYTAGMRIPGTVDHVLRIIAGWHDDMREPIIAADDADVEADGVAGRGASPVRGDAGDLQSRDSGVAERAA